MKKDKIMIGLSICMIVLSICGICICLYYYLYGFNDNHFIMVNEISGGTDIIEFKEYNIIPNEKYENYVIIKSSVSTNINVNVSVEMLNNYKQILKDNLNLIIIFNDEKIYEDKFNNFIEIDDYCFDYYVIEEEENILELIYYLDNIGNEFQEEKVDFNILVNVKKWEE